MQYKAVIFDLDGTLINSLADLADSVNEVLASHGYPVHLADDYKMMVGNGARMLIKRALPRGAADTLIDEVLAEYKEIYEKRFLNKTKPYPGIIPLLAKLKRHNIKLAVCSNKHDKAVTAIIEALFPQGTFQYAWGEQAGVPRKPAPDAVLKLAELMQVKPAETVYIGDSGVDMQTGTNAGMLTVGALWGFREQRELKQNSASLLLNEPQELWQKISFDKGGEAAMLYPLKLQAVLKDYLWGGTKLKSDFNKQSDLAIVAESWELSCHKDGQSVIANGEYQGMKLSEYIDKTSKAVLGTNAAKFTYFPILIKLIDAAGNLSVQVHPENDYALRVEGEYGKTEMWYVVDAEPGAELLYGFKAKISKDEFKDRIENNTLLEVCNSVPVKKGDVFFIDAGTLHAIGKGIVIAEIQQNSNTTYRIYDYGRIGTDGKPRQLHIAKALDVTKLEPPTRACTAEAEMNFLQDLNIKLLAQCEYFKVYNLNIKAICKLTADKTSFQSIVVLAGSLELKSPVGSLKLVKGDSVFVPAGLGDYTISGNGEIILSMI